ncbi:MAG: nucleotidyltransferase family protein [Alphaproteobacteria bacterium]|nr:nucleotidyltransferase family protein [Alphaproteobacteria bacterium]
MMPEFRLFCLAVRRPQREEDIAALSREIAAEPDWNCLIEGARRHRVAPLLLAGQQACRSPHLPTTVVAGLRQQALAAAKRGLVQTREISRLSRIFSQAEIRILALKGVVLSAQLFGDAGVRNPRDIDLLADPNEFARAEALLIEAGYRRSGPILSPRQTAAYRRWVKDTGYLHTAAGINVELHHRLSDNPALIPFDFAALWREREKVQIAGALIATLPRAISRFICACTAPVIAGKNCAGSSIWRPPCSRQAQRTRRLRQASGRRCSVL